MKRYGILVIEHGSRTEVELCQVDENPHAVAEAVASKRLRVAVGKRRAVYVPKYTSVRVIEHAADGTGGG